jgi:hypothetical protein
MTVSNLLFIFVATLAFVNLVSAQNHDQSPHLRYTLREDDSCGRGSCWEEDQSYCSHKQAQLWQSISVGVLHQLTL